MKLTPREIEQAVGNLPPILNVDQAAKLAQVPRKTIYTWSSLGHLDSCSRRRGKRLLIIRDRFMEELFNGKDW